MSYAQYCITARIIGKPPHNNVDGSADGNRIPPHHAASHQTPLKSVILHRIPPYHAQRIGLRIRRPQVRVLPSAPLKALQKQGFSFILKFSCLSSFRRLTAITVLTTFKLYTPLSCKASVPITVYRSLEPFALAVRPKLDILRVMDHLIG